MSLPDELQEQLKYCSGARCRCYASSWSECGCDVDWRERDEVVMDWVREHKDLAVVAEYLGMGVDASNA